MFQEILALLAVAGAIFFAIRGLYLAVIQDPKGGSSPCSGCVAGSCAPRSFKTVKK